MRLSAETVRLESGRIYILKIIQLKPVMKRLVGAIITFVICLNLQAQDDLPQDYLPAKFHADRRDSLRKLMPDNSVAVFFAFPTRTYSNDVEYLYHQNPDLYYFSGYKEPHSMLLVFKEPQTLEDGRSATELLYVQKKNAQAEQWTGRRLGAEAAREKLGIPIVYNGEEFRNLKLDFSKFTKVIFDRFPADMPPGRPDRAELHDLVSQFKSKAAIPENYSKDERFNGGLYQKFTGALREIKTEEEMALLRKAVEISCMGQIEVMKAVRADMSEKEIQGLHEYIHKRYGAESVGYPSIVGAGHNGCILHYIDNSRTRVGRQLILMDVGAEYHGYTADVTRTIPANGKFSPEQKIIYNLVYDAQEAAFRLCKNGATWVELNNAAKQVIADGLLNLGIIKKKEEVNRYYPHGLGHHIGLDVHDRSFSPVLKKGMVVTIEPGIYIPDDSPCDKKWWGIAVRIEDDVLIREKDFEMLSALAPRTIEDIEKTIAQRSILDKFKLQPLPSQKKGF